MSEQETVVMSPEEAAAAEPDVETEVRTEELTQGTAQPIGASAFPEDVVEALRQPLDPNRVRRRKGRGRGQFEYLAGHDVKRRANELFGFGNWGHLVTQRELLGAVEVESEQGGHGWHVGYATTVRVWVRIGERGRYETEGVGYGDGVEYVAAARITACELAIKESETDALKRAFTDLGDQFGLILYAKDDEKRRIERDAAAEQPARARDVRVEATERSQAPRSFQEILERLVTATGHPEEDWTGWWVPQMIEVMFPGKSTTRDLTNDERNVLGQRLGTVVLALEELMSGRDFPPPVRFEIQALIATLIEGVTLDGPPYRIDPEEQERPSAAEWSTQQQEQDPELEKLAEETISGPDA